MSDWVEQLREGTLADADAVSSLPSPLPFEPAAGSVSEAVFFSRHMPLSGTLALTFMVRLSPLASSTTPVSQLYEAPPPVQVKGAEKVTFETSLENVSVSFSGPL